MHDSYKHGLALAAALVGCAASGTNGPTSPVVPPPVVDVPVTPAEVAAPAPPPPPLPMRTPRTDEVDVEATLVVTIAADGAVYAADRSVDDAKLVEVAKRWHEAHPEMHATLCADGGAPYERVIQVMDLLKQGGIIDVAFAVSCEP